MLFRSNASYTVENDFSFNPGRVNIIDISFIDLWPFGWTFPQAYDGLDTRVGAPGFGWSNLSTPLNYEAIKDEVYSYLIGSAWARK